MGWTAAHAGQAIWSCASQEVENDRLGLVVGGMAGRDANGEDRAARRTSAPEVGTRLQGDPKGSVPGTEAIGGGLHHVGLRLRTGSQAMIDVAGDRLTAARDRQHQQRERVGTS